MKFTLSILFLSIFYLQADAQLYKAMMDDAQVNFYDVVAEANRYFEKNGKGKGSGWTPFQRWVERNEALFYPSGDRSKYDALQSVRAYEKFKREAKSYQRTNANYDWLDLGPYTADSITTHYSPGIGRVECVYVDPLDLNKMYLSSRSGGFWRSVDGGQTWTNTTDNLMASGVNTFDVNPGNSDDILINIQSSLNNTTFGIYRSLDGGVTWNSTIFNPGNQNIGGFGTNHKVKEIQFHDDRPDTIFVATTEGLFRSTDNFSTITEVKTGSYGQVEIHPTQPNIIYITHDYYWSRNKFYRSIDGGTTFTQLHDLVANNYSYPKLSTTPANPNVVFFTSGNGIWKSSDAGVTFTFIPNSDQFGNTFGVSDVDEDKIIKGVLDIYRSDDGWNSWTQSSEWYLPAATPDNYVHADMRYVYSLNGTFYIGTDGYMAKSPDFGVTWEILSNGTSIREYYKLGVSQTDAGVVSCGSQDNGSSYFDNGQWIEWVGADGMEQLIHPMNKNYAIGNIQNGNKRQTKDGAQTQKAINNHESTGFSWVAPLAYNPMHQSRIYAVGDKLLRSENFGDSWITLHNFGSDRMDKFAVAENNEDLMLVSNNDDLYKSVDGGSTFSQIGAGILPTYSITDIAFDPNDDNTFILTYGQYQDDNSRIYMTQNGGTTFQNISYNLSAIPARSVVIDHSNESIIYIGTEIGVYTMPKGGSSYQLFSNNLPPVGVNELEIQYGSNSIMAATWGRGLWQNCLLNRNNYPKFLKVEMEQNGAEDIISANSNTITVTMDKADEITSMFAKYSINSIALNQTIDFARNNETQFTNLNNMPVSVDGDRLYFKIYAVNANNDTTETYRYMYTFGPKPGYCSGSGSSGTGSDYIDNVIVNGVQNPSGKTQYSDFTSVVFDIDNFDTVQIEVHLNFAFVQDSAGAWIDWDNSGTFDLDETIVFGSFANNIATAQIAVPLSAKVGTYRLRTRVAYNANPSPCGTVAGEVEDYTINILEACPTNAVVTNLNDRNEGSLRFWVINTCAGDTITFDPSLMGDTLTLYSAVLKNIESKTVVGHASTNFTISGNDAIQLFRNSGQLNLVNLNLINSGAPSNGGAILNLNSLTLRDVLLEHNFEGSTQKTLTNNGNIEVLTGTSVIKE